jgi:hypothetical protein
MKSLEGMMSDKTKRGVRANIQEDVDTSTQVFELDQLRLAEVAKPATILTCYQMVVWEIYINFRCCCPSSKAV